VVTLSDTKLYKIPYLRLTLFGTILRDTKQGTSSVLSGLAQFFL